MRLGDVRAKAVAKRCAELEEAERALRRAAAAGAKQKEIEWALRSGRHEAFSGCFFTWTR